MALGQGDFKYEAVEGWGNLPEGWVFSLVSDAAVDSQGRIYAFTRGKHPVIVFDKAGNFITSWGYGEFGLTSPLVSEPHGIFIGPGDKVYLVDALQHIVRRYTRLGEMEREWGRPGVAGMTHYRGEYNIPTGGAIGPDGSMYVSDGYGNRCVHKYSKEGKHLFSWGEGGNGPGQFAVVHNIDCDRTGRVLVCDRENNRIQIFDSDGAFIEEWTDLVGPGGVCIAKDNMIYVAEHGGDSVSVWSPEGERISRFSGPDVKSAHGICVDDEGSIYVAEINRGQRLQKFVRVSG